MTKISHRETESLVDSASEDVPVVKISLNGNENWLRYYHVCLDQ